VQQRHVFGQHEAESRMVRRFSAIRRRWRAISAIFQSNFAPKKVYDGVEFQTLAGRALSRSFWNSTSEEGEGL
jgi:hypothetical protein